MSGRPVDPVAAAVGSTARVVAMLSDAHADDYRVVDRLAGGETGATEIRRADGRRFVMKCEADPERRRRRRSGVELAERLRVAGGWPVPRQQTVELDRWLVVLQDFMPGTTVDHLSHDLVDELIDLHETRIGLAPDGSPSYWSTDMIEVLVEGGNGYCLHQPLRDFDARTRRTVERIEEIGRNTRSCDLDGRDIVHGDLHPGNVLQRSGRLSAVVDLDFCRVGDADFDLVMLAIAGLEVSVSPGVRQRLFHRAMHGLTEPKRLAYTSNVLLRNLDWAIRKHRPGAIEFWLAEVDRLMPR